MAFPSAPLHEFEGLTLLSLGVKTLLGPKGAYISFRLSVAYPPNLEVLESDEYILRKRTYFMIRRLVEFRRKWRRRRGRLERLRDIRGAGGIHP